MVVAACAVGMAVLELFFRRIANIDDFNVEIQILAGEWMITINCHVCVVDGRAVTGHTGIFSVKLKSRSLAGSVAAVRVVPAARPWSTQGDATPSCHHNTRHDRATRLHAATRALPTVTNFNPPPHCARAMCVFLQHARFCSPAPHACKATGARSHDPTAWCTTTSVVAREWGSSGNRQRGTDTAARLLMLLPTWPGASGDSGPLAPNGFPPSAPDAVC